MRKIFSHHLFYYFRSFLIACFILTSFPLPLTHAKDYLPASQAISLPKPGVRVSLSPEFAPAILKGITVHITEKQIVMLTKR